MAWKQKIQVTETAPRLEGPVADARFVAFYDSGAQQSDCVLLDSLGNITTIFPNVGWDGGPYISDPSPTNISRNPAGMVSWLFTGSGADPAITVRITDFVNKTLNEVVLKWGVDPNGLWYVTPPAGQTYNSGLTSYANYSPHSGILSLLVGYQGQTSPWAPPYANFGTYYRMTYNILTGQITKTVTHTFYHDNSITYNGLDHLDAIAGLYTLSQPDYDASDRLPAYIRNRHNEYIATVYLTMPYGEEFNSFSETPSYLFVRSTRHTVEDVAYSYIIRKSDGHVWEIKDEVGYYTNSIHVNERNVGYCLAWSPDERFLYLPGRTNSVSVGGMFKSQAGCVIDMTTKTICLRPMYQVSASTTLANGFVPGTEYAEVWTDSYIDHNNILYIVGNDYEMWSMVLRYDLNTLTQLDTLFNYDNGTYPFVYSVVPSIVDAQVSVGEASLQKNSFSFGEVGSVEEFVAPQPPNYYSYSSQGGWVLLRVTNTYIGGSEAYIWGWLDEYGVIVYTKTTYGPYPPTGTAVGGVYTAGDPVIRFEGGSTIVEIPM